MKLPKNFGMGGLGNIMKQAQEAMEKAQELEKHLEQEVISIDKGPIKAEFTGQGKIKSIKIDPSIVDANDVEALEDLILTTVREGIQRAELSKAERMKKIMPNAPDQMPHF